jgi:RHS repeat-associated protein
MLTDGDNLYLVGHDTLGRWDGAAWVYHLPDELGSVRQVTDGAGAVVSSREWTPFGVEVGAAQAGLGYTGEWWDAAVGLQYLRARWYDGWTGRFTRKDPSRLEANPYLYASANPINRADPSGLLSNETIRKSFGVSSFEDVLAITELSQDWGYLKMLQDAEVGDRAYAGPFSWTSYLGTIECYDPGRHSPEPSYWPGPWLGGVVFVSSSGEEHLLEQSKRGEAYMGPPDWYFLNNNYVLPAYTTKTDYGYLPDYVVGSGGGPLGALIGIPFLGVNINVVVDRYGNIYGGLGAEVGDPGLDLEVALGWLNQYPLTPEKWIPELDDLQGFIEGWGGGVAGYAVIGGGIAYNYDFPRGLFSEALGGEAGIAIPTVGWSFLEYMFWVTQVPGLEWDWVDRYPIEHGYGRQDIRMVDDRPVDCGC